MFLAVAASFGVCSAAFAQTVPSWNAGGQDWRCSQKCREGLAGRPTPIAQTGRDFILTNEAGQTASGIYEEGYKIRVPDWNATAIFSDDLKTLTFYPYGTVWAR
jgi:hypothetical protein